MDFDRSKHNVIKYLPTNNDENIWGMSISGIGFQSIDPKGSYPLKGHPIGYTFNPDRGRIIDEFALVYIVKGEGTFASINCFEKKISKGDAFFIFPGQWHSYQPIANIGWDEYYVTFQGDYFEKLLEEIKKRLIPNKSNGEIKRIYEEEPSSIVKEKIEQTMQVSQSLYCIGIKDNQIKCKDKVKKHIAVEIILNLLFGKSSELYKKLYDDGTIYSTPSLDYEFSTTYAHVLLTGQSNTCLLYTSPSPRDCS
mgnify:CR=1 FL=1